MNKDLEYFNKIEEMFNDVDFYNEEIDILFHYMSCHINNNSCECLFLDEYEYICGGDRSHNSIINRINELYKNYKSL